VPFYFTPSKVAGFFHCETPSLDNMACVPRVRDAVRGADRRYAAAPRSCTRAMRSRARTRARAR
jgi:hypothetical protein